MDTPQPPAAPEQFPATQIPGIAPWLRQILRCPACKGDLNNAPPAPGQPQDGPAALECHVCNLAYPVIGGIPVLLASQAQPLG
jgi:uncharacterized protein YbaR (Trm112 family)